MKKISKYFFGEDTFIRHICTAWLCGEFDPKMIADVGGEGSISLFLSEAEVISINIEKIKCVNVLFDGKKIPFKDNSFETAISLDTFEHMPKTQRLMFCREMLRISKKGIIICAPLGTDQHIEREKEALKTYDLDPAVKNYLQQHCEMGLPTPMEVMEIAEKLKGKVYYQGDFRKIKIPQNIISRHLTLLIQIGKNIITEAISNKKNILKQNFSAYTNRFFLVAYKRI